MSDSIIEQSNTNKTALYRHFDADNQLLYIGVSISAVDRFEEHQIMSEWAFQSVRMDTQWFDSKEEALAAEKHAIKNEHPKFNKAHSKINRQKKLILSNSSQIFQFLNHPLRVFTDQDNDPWFIAKDVADILDYTDAQAMTRRLDDDEKSNRQIVGLTLDSNREIGGLGPATGGRGITLINESDLYSCVLTSQKPQAKTFKRWITHEVLPSIRKTGSYTKPETGKSLFDSEAEKAQQLPFEKIQTSKLIRLSKMSKSLAQAYLIESGVTPDYVNGLLSTLGDAAATIGISKGESTEAIVTHFLSEWKTQVIDAPFVPCLGRQVMRLFTIWVDRQGILVQTGDNLIMSSIYQQPGFYKKRHRVERGVNSQLQNMLLIVGQKQPVNMTVNDWISDCVAQMEAALKKLED